MRFSTIQSIVLATAGLTRAQDLRCCTARSLKTWKNVPALDLAVGTTSSLVPNGYSSLNWANLYGVSPSIVAQFLLPQGKNFVVAPDSTTPPVISAPPGGKTVKPVSIFMGTFLKSMLGGAAALSSPSIITVTATFDGGERGPEETVFNFSPANTIFGLPLNAEPLQYFKFPCDWTQVKSLSFVYEAENVASEFLGLAIDNFELVDGSNPGLFECV